MERVVALGRRVLPRGWRDFGIQLGIWFGFYFSYLAVRHLTDKDPTKAVVNGLRVISLEQHDPPPLRAERGAGRRLVAATADGRGVDLLELGVHGDRPDAALGLPPPARGVQPLPQH